MEENLLRATVAREIALFECARPAITKDIDAVLVFSGPGTVCEPISTGDSEWLEMEWADLTRVIRGISIVLKVTSLRLEIPLGQITKDEVARRGPYFIYNGVNSKHENQDLLAYLSLPRSLIPKDKLIIIDKVEDEDGSVREIKHTGDQVRSIPRYLLEEHVSSIALVSHAPHFPRILRYIAHGSATAYWKWTRIHSFPTPSKPEWATRYANSEIEALIGYLKAGFLAEDPYPVDLGLG